MNKLAFAQTKRVLSQKILYLYLIAVTALAVETCVRYLKNPSDQFAQAYSGARFPMGMLQSQLIILAPIVLAILAAALITGETAAGMLKQPLLQGYSRRELAAAKIVGLLLPTLMLYFSICVINYAICLVGWGTSVLREPLFIKWLGQVLLLSLPLAALCLGIILMSTYTRSIGLLLSAVSVIVLCDSLLNQFFPAVVRNFSFLYYIYAFADYNNISLDFSTLIRGIPICIISGITFYILIHRKFKKTEIY